MMNMKDEKSAKAITGSALPMNGGNGTNSYSNNSYYQKLSADVEKEKILELIAEKLDMKKLLSPISNSTIRIADLGCATGPNTFMIMQDTVEAMKQKYQSQSCPDDEMPEFQVLFNDVAMNDFNTLFTSLPQDRQYFAAGVPGSCHGRLFPESSIHFVHTSFAIHWLSKLPAELQNKESPAWNKGRIHYANAPREVVDAYASQFAEDMSNFLNARAKELVPGGMMVIIIIGVPKGLPFSQTPTGIIYDSISSSLVDMANEGFIDESEVDSFNMPFYAASPEEMAGLVEENGCFSMERMELSNPAMWFKSPSDHDITAGAISMHVRAAAEGMFATHFGTHLMDELFGRFTKKLIHHPRCCNKSQMFVALKRK